MDSRAGTRYATELPEALAACTAGRLPGALAGQTVAKGLQHVDVLAVQAALEGLAAPTPAERLRAAQLAAAWFEGVRPTLVRRDADAGGAAGPGGGLVRRADAALEGLRGAAAAGSAAGPGARRALERILAETYARSVLYELEGVEALRDRSPDRCAEKRLEGQIFLRILAPWLQRERAGAADALGRMLAGEPGQVSASVGRRLLGPLIPVEP